MYQISGESYHSNYQAQEKGEVIRLFTEAAAKYFMLLP